MKTKRCFDTKKECIKSIRGLPATNAGQPYTTNNAGTIKYRTHVKTTYPLASFHLNWHTSDEEVRDFQMFFGTRRQFRREAANESMRSGGKFAGRV